MLGWESASSPTFSKEKTNGNRNPSLDNSDRFLHSQPFAPFFIQSVLNCGKLDVRLETSMSEHFLQGENKRKPKSFSRQLRWQSSLTSEQATLIHWAAGGGNLLCPAFRHVVPFDPIPNPVAAIATRQ